MINQMSFIALVHLGVCVCVWGGGERVEGGNLACPAVLEIHIGGEVCV